MGGSLIQWLHCPQRPSQEPQQGRRYGCHEVEKFKSSDFRGPSYAIQQIQKNPGVCLPRSQKGCDETECLQFYCCGLRTQIPDIVIQNLLIIPLSRSQKSGKGRDAWHLLSHFCLLFAIPCAWNSPGSSLITTHFQVLLLSFPRALHAHLGFTTQNFNLLIICLAVCSLHS